MRSCLIIRQIKHTQQPPRVGRNTSHSQRCFALTTPQPRIPRLRHSFTTRQPLPIAQAPAAPPTGHLPRPCKAILNTNPRRSMFCLSIARPHVSFVHLPVTSHLDHSMARNRFPASQTQLNILSIYRFHASQTCSIFCLSIASPHLKSSSGPQWPFEYLHDHTQHDTAPSLPPQADPLSV
jgi:hypothetical protein